MTGHVTNLSATAPGEGFGRRVRPAGAIGGTVSEPGFEIGGDVVHRADSFVTRFDANTNLYTSRAPASAVARHHRGPLAGVSARTLPIASDSDSLHPSSAARQSEEALVGLVEPAGFPTIDAPRGRGCFVLEGAGKTPISRRLREEFR